MGDEHDQQKAILIVLTRSQKQESPKIDVSEVIKMLIHILTLVAPDNEQKPNKVYTNPSTSGLRRAGAYFGIASATTDPQNDGCVQKV